MRIARYLVDGAPNIGIIRDGMVNSLPGAHDLLTIVNMPIVERSQLEAEAGRDHRFLVEDTTFLPPVEPRAMRDFVAFEAHIAGMKKAEDGDGNVPEAWYEQPAFLFMNPWSLVGASDDVPMPPHTSALDFELEVAAVIGKPARDVSPHEAGDYIVGYTILNDWSARDLQRREMSVGLGPSKGKDFASTLGPWLTTPDELEHFRVGDRLDLTMTVSINGVETGRDSLKNMSWSFEELLSHASRGAMVGPGDVLATGTAASGALSEAWSRSGRQVPPPLRVGDVVTMSVEGLGTITNRVVESNSPGIRVPRARRTYSEDRL